jgi:hypothetical protein
MAPIERVSVRFTIWLAINPGGKIEISKRKMMMTTKMSKYTITEGDIFFNIDASS